MKIQRLVTILKQEPFKEYYKKIFNISLFSFSGINSTKSIFNWLGIKIPQGSGPSWPSIIRRTFHELFTRGILLINLLYICIILHGDNALKL